MTARRAATEHKGAPPMTATAFDPQPERHRCSTVARARNARATTHPKVTRMRTRLPSSPPCNDTTQTAARRDACNTAEDGTA